MSNNEFMYAVERSDEYLAHYGIRGMKWGVRKAIASGNSARLGRQYAKAQKKLAKLEKQASNSKKYARRAALMGAGAAAAGGLAAAGTGGVARGLARTGGAVMKAKGALGAGMRTAGGAMARTNLPGIGKAGRYMMGAGRVMERQNKIGSATFKRYADASKAVNDWGKGTSVSDAMRKGLYDANQKVSSGVNKALGYNNAITKASGQATSNAVKGLKGVSNNTIARIGAGAVGAGLAVGAARNAYKAATAQKRAAKFRSAMNESFKGTKYANGGQPRQGNKKRRNRG